MSEEQTVNTSVETETSSVIEETNATANQELEAAPEGITQEIQSEQSPTESEEDKRFAAKFAALSRKEKAIRERERQVERRLKEIEAQTASQQKPEVKPEEEPLKLRALKKPFDTLKELGLDYETLTRIALNDGQLTPELQMQILREELDGKYRSEIDQIKKQLQDKQEAEEKAKESQTVQGFKNEIASTIKSNTEEFELLGVEGENGIELVFDTINEHYNETGEVLDIVDAAKAVEDHLLGEAKKRIELHKIKKLVGASQVAQPPAKAEKKVSMTLSNEKSQVQPSSKSYMSDDESKREAAKLIKWIQD